MALRLSIMIYTYLHNLTSLSGWLVGWLCLTSHRQRGHLETAPPFTVPCEGREARYIHRSDRDLNPGPSHGSPLRYRCATQAPHHFLEHYTNYVDTHEHSVFIDVSWKSHLLFIADDRGVDSLSPNPNTFVFSKS